MHSSASPSSTMAPEVTETQAFINRLDEAINRKLQEMGDLLARFTENVTEYKWLIEERQREIEALAAQI